MDNPKEQITERLKQATNVLVTVSANPSVDQLAGAIGITLLLNKLGKHATAVFSGQIPSTIEFLQPEKTLEKNTDSLRDFIIALDKSKADKLRYKVEDQMVKIFITPYRTSISDKDLEFSQGDFNVEVVLAIGVNEQADVDQAISAHGRILHDATVVGINTKDGANLGTINWVQPDASSLSQMLVDLGQTLKADALDGQMATAFLTGIVAETERFSNEKTSSAAMQMSAKLMAAGANQQLVASQLEPPVLETPPPAEPPAVEEEVAELPEVAPPAEPAEEPVVEPPVKETPPEPVPEEEEKSKAKDGELEIDHGESVPYEGDDEDPSREKMSQIAIDDQGKLKRLDENNENKGITSSKDSASDEESNTPSHLVLQPPTHGGTLTASTQVEDTDPSIDALGTVPDGPMLSHDSPKVTSQTPTQTAPASVANDTTTAPEPSTILSDLEKNINSPHAEQANEPSGGESGPSANVDSAREAVQAAVKGATPQILEPVHALNANPMDLNLSGPSADANEPVAPMDTSVTSDAGLPPGLVPTDPGLPVDATAAPATDSTSTAPPAVPPPMMPPAAPLGPFEDPNSPRNTAL